jgi:hypothetical protein
MSDSHYIGGVPTVSIDDAVEIAELCLLAGRPERIAEFLGDRLTPGLVRDRLSAAPVPAAQPAASRSIFGEPTPAERDALTEAVRRRFEAMAKGGR